MEVCLRYDMNSFKYISTNFVNIKCMITVVDCLRVTMPYNNNYVVQGIALSLRVLVSGADMITRQFFARHASQCSAQADVEYSSLSKSSSEREDQCPICGLSYPISILPLHASNCGL